MARRARLALALLLLSAGTARAESVVLFPLDARGVAKETADRATNAALAALRAVRGLQLIDSATVEKRLGVHLTAQARACEYDTFCLVEVGELLRSQRILIGHVRRTPAKEKGASPELELKLVVLDVAKAVVSDVLVWHVPDDEVTLAEAANAAARRLVAPPDGKLLFELQPPGVHLSVYGDPLILPKEGPLPFWSGTYLLRARADAYQPVELKVVVVEGAPTKVSIELQPDLLWTKKKADPKAEQPFSKSSRREGSGVTAEEVGRLDPGQLDRGSPLANPLAWSLGGVGAVAVVVGSVLMGGAQSSYNELSAQQRYLPGVTVSAAEAIERRNDARGRFRTGSIITTAGVLALVGGAAWMIVDSATRPSPLPAGALHGSSLSGWEGSW